MKPLIVLCAGDTSLHQASHRHWSHPSRQYTLAILYYGTDPDKKQQYRDEADYFHAQQGPKWALVRNFLITQTALWHTRTFVAFPDDDLDITTTQWNTLFDYGRNYNLDLYQPSLVNNGPQYISHPLLICKPQNTLRFVNFVEVMVPIFSQRALRRAVDKRVLTNPRLKSGWGIDYVLPQTVLPHHKFDYPSQHTVNKHTYYFAVVDAVPITHTKPLSNTADAKTSSFYKTYNIDPKKEMRDMMHAFHVRLFTPITLRCVPVCVTYTPTPTCTPAQQPKRRPRPNKQNLPVYLTQNIDHEISRVNAQRHPLYKSSVDIEQFYHKVSQGFHARIRRNTLHIVRDFGSFESRNKNTIAMLLDVLCRYKIDDVDILVSTDDFVRQPDVRGVPILCMAKTSIQTYITYPDHTFYTWTEAHTQSWDQERKRLSRTVFPHPKPLALFRGNLSTFYLREYLANASRQERQHTRRHKSNKSKKNRSHTSKGTLSAHKATQRHTQGKRNTSSMRVCTPVLDVAGIDVGALAHNTRSSTPRAAHTSNFVPLHDHAKWKYLLHIPGRSYAARLKYLLASNSVVLYVKKQKKYEYTEFWYRYLKDTKNCVVIHDDNVYDARNRIVVQRNKHGKKIWNDTANENIVKQIRTTVHQLESKPHYAKSLVQANRTWRQTFDYEMVLKYFGVVLNEIANIKNL